MSQKSLLTKLGETLDAHRAERRDVSDAPQPRPARRWARWLPSPGNAIFTVVFTLLVITTLLWAQSAGALTLNAPAAASTGVVAYQGRLANTGGAPLTGVYNMIFRLYAATSGGSPLWEEQWTGPNSVQVSDGLFNVMLGSLTPIPQAVVAANPTLFLGITVGTDGEMSPRVQLGSVPFAVQALTVPDGSITKAKLAPDVSLLPPAGSITTTMIADRAVTKDKLANGLFRIHLASTTTTNWSFSCTNTNQVIPGVSLNLSLPAAKSVLIDFSGLVRTTEAGTAIFSSIFVDNQPAQAQDNAPLIGGCRNENSGGNLWCDAGNTFAAQLSPGNHTIDVRVGCDSPSGGRVWTGAMRVVELPL